jgi:hypothetical protein
MSRNKSIDDDDVKTKANKALTNKTKTIKQLNLPHMRCEAPQL